MTQQNQELTQQIIQYYDRCEPHYRLHWDLSNSHALHYGFWDATTHNFSQALQRINAVMANTIALNNADFVLDAGCGIGGSAIWLAKHIGCRTLGITLSQRQVATATKLAQQQGVAHLAQFGCADYTQTQLPNQHVSAVWAIESLCHAANKLAFTNEAARILQSGGRLVVADFFIRQTPPLNTTETRIINKWANGWAVPQFDTIGQMQANLYQSGFRDIEVKNITSHILPSAKRLYWHFFPGWVATRLYGLYKKVPSFVQQNVWTAYWQYIALRKNLWQYYLVSAVKA